MQHRLSAVLVLAAAAASAHGDIVDMHFTGIGRGQRVQIERGGRSTDTFVGQLLYEVTSGTGFGEQFLGPNVFYCVDLFEAVSAQDSEYVITSLTEVPDSDPMSGSTAEAIYAIFAWAEGEQFESGASSALAAAFQLAVWEIVSDYDEDVGRLSLDVEEGWFQVRAIGGDELDYEVLAHLDSLFDAVGSDFDFDGSVVAFRSETAQDQLGAIPVPGSSAAFAAGLLFVVGRRRR